MHTLIYQYLSEIADERQAVKMAVYMKNQFVFLGVSAPQRKKISSVFFREMKRSMINTYHTRDVQAE